MRVNNRKTLAVCVALALSLSMAGCTSAPPMTLEQPDLTFAQMQDIPLSVARIEVIDLYKPAGDKSGGKNVEGEFSTPPAVAARNLINSKLKPSGGHQVLRAYIDDASVRMQGLPVRTDWQGMFIQEPAEKYIARVAIRFELADETAPDIVVARANVSSDRTSTLTENASLAQRDQAYMALTEALMRDIYEGLATTVRGNFGTPR